jgi:geranylgeranyl reductase family protein
MTVSDSHEVLIIGAGPAGSTLGYLLAEKGLDVLVLDKETFPRPKLCGGALTWKTRKLLEEVFKTPFKTQSSTDSVAEDYAIYEKFKRKIYQSAPEPFYFVDREKYDATLVSLAKEKGCRFQFKMRVTEINLRTATVYAYSGNEFREQKEFTGKIIIGADGVNSVLRTRIFPELDFHHNSGLAFQVTIPMSKIKQEYCLPVPRLFLGDVKCGYGWIFPHGEQFVVGLWGLIRKNKRVKETFHHFLNKVTEIKVDELSRLPSHLGPAGNFMESPGEGNILLVGDAAGFADPLTGEGIYYAHKSAECAAKAIFDYFESGEKSVILESYKSYLTPTLKELRISLRFRNLVYSDLRQMAFFILRNSRVYFKLAGVVHGTKSYSRLPFLSR